ncbi:hypothetical protein [Methyloraptor flagellatus]|uniref:DUF4231 domain-containing protein n=1 Tax=Methyloraptor flagellatus TaxID=3162530 RepID=A0AAU7XFR8_9HYPH
MVARVALSPEIGASLHVPTPFALADYEADFDTPDDLAEFRKLFAAATEGSFALDGARGDLEARSYEAVGRLVVRQSDVLIALWDGKPGGRGGTGDIVRYAAAVGVPVVWINTAEAAPPRWIAEPLDLVHTDGAPSDWAIAMGVWLATIVEPPKPPRRQAHGLLDRMAGWLRSKETPLERFFGERPLPDHRLWHAHRRLIALATRSALPRVGHSRQVDGAEADGYWYQRFAPADSRAAEYALRYRSSYVWVFLLATVALVCGASALALAALIGSDHEAELLVGLKSTATWVEFVCLVAVLALVVAVKARDWHERSIEYRLLAELARKQQVLAPLGWTLPIVAVRTAVGEHGTRPRDPSGWVAWLFAAWQRGAPFAAGAISEDGLRHQSDTLAKLVAEQALYHRERHTVAHRASATLERTGVFLFLAVGVFVALKLLLGHWTHDAHGGPWDRIALLLGWAATVLPAASAAFVGIRAYAELELLAVQSRHMEVELRHAAERVARIAGGRPLASQALGSEATAVTTLMLQDLEGWARLFRIKAAELG